MRQFQRFLLAALGTLTLSAVSATGTMQCDGNFISPGDTEAQVLEHCGEPASRQGSTWTYQGDGNIPRLVIFGNGVVMFIRDGEPEGFGSTSPLGDPP